MPRQHAKERDDVWLCTGVLWAVWNSEARAGGLDSRSQLALLQANGIDEGKHGAIGCRGEGVRGRIDHKETNTTGMCCVSVISTFFCIYVLMSSARANEFFFCVSNGTHRVEWNISLNGRAGQPSE